MEEERLQKMNVDPEMKQLESNLRRLLCAIVTACLVLLVTSLNTPVRLKQPSE